LALQKKHVIIFILTKLQGIFLSNSMAFDFFIFPIQQVFSINY